MSDLVPSQLAQHPFLPLGGKECWHLLYPRYVFLKFSAIKHLSYTTWFAAVKGKRGGMSSGLRMSSVSTVHCARCKLQVLMRSNFQKQGQRSHTAAYLCQRQALYVACVGGDSG